MVEKKIKQMHGDYHIQVHTIRLKTQFVWLRREYSTQYEACLVEKKHVQRCNTIEILLQKGKGHLRRG